MFIATELKKQNIVEYLLYMWQIEDLIRAFGLDMNRINEKIVKPYQLSDYDKKRLFEWYESLIEMMRTENAQDVGHIQLNKNIIIQLNDFHTELLNSGIEAAIDRISFEHHELSGRAKDYASAAVFLSLVLCGAVWLAAIWQRLTA